MCLILFDFSSHPRNTFGRCSYSLWSELNVPWAEYTTVMLPQYLTIDRPVGVNLSATSDSVGNDARNENTAREHTKEIQLVETTLSKYTPHNKGL